MRITGYSKHEKREIHRAFLDSHLSATFLKTSKTMPCFLSSSTVENPKLAVFLEADDASTDGASAEESEGSLWGEDCFLDDVVDIMHTRDPEFKRDDCILRGGIMPPRDNDSASTKD